MKYFYLLCFFLISFRGSSQVDSTAGKEVVQERYTFESISVSFIPPAHFKVSDKFTGFIHDGAATTILVEVKDGKPYHILTEAVINEESLAEQGVRLIAKESVNTGAGDPATVIQLGFEVKAKDGKAYEFERLMLITGNEKRTVTIVANYPVMAKNVLFEVLKQSILTVEF